MKSKKGLIFGILGIVIFFALGIFIPDPHKGTIASFIAQDIRIAIPLAIAAVGMVYGERSGILNLGTEGLMLTGALFTWIGAAMFGGNPWLGSLLGMFAAMIMALLFAFLVITVRANQTVIGVSINILALGLTSTVYRAVSMDLGNSIIDSFPMIDAEPIVGNIPVIGDYLTRIFSQSVIVYIGIVAILFLQFFLFKTDLGLKVRAVGEYPKACDTMGINVFKIRYGSVLFSGILAGFAGGLLVLDIGAFIENLTAGKGFIAIAAVIFGKYTPIGAFGATIVFGGAQAFQFLVEAIGWDIPSDLLNMLPYIITIVALAGFIGKTHKPAASTIPYTKE